MADAIVLPQAPSVSLPSRLVRLLPGVALLAAIGYAGKLLEKNINGYTKANHWTFPEHRIRTVGDSDRAVYLERVRIGGDFQARCGHV